VKEEITYEEQKERKEKRGIHWKEDFQIAKNLKV